MNIEQWLDHLKYTATPSFEECLDVLGPYFPALYKLEETPQDPKWHAEGNVAIHTAWVLSEVYQLLNAHPLSPQRRQALILGALLHDIGKPATTITCPETNRIKSPNHEQAGKIYLVFRLLELNLDQSVYLEILELVGQHQKPKFLVIRNLAHQHYYKLMRDCDFMQLYYLEVADMKGRICDDLDLQLMYLEEFKAICHSLMESQQQDIEVDELSMLKGRFGLCEGYVTHVSEFTSRYKFTNRPGSLTLLCGVIGSGKSTYISGIKTKNTVVISLDDIRAEVSFRADQSQNKKVLIIANERLLQALRENKDVIWDATNTRKDFRDKLINVALNYHVFVNIVVILKYESTIRLQNKKRAMPVPDHIVDQQIQRFQLPTQSEAHQVTYLIH